MLNDEQIKRSAEQNSLINPFNEEQLQPHSYDCTLDEVIKVAETDATKSAHIFTPHTCKDSAVLLPQGVFALGATQEYIKLPDNVVGFVQGKSTIGRNGLQIECAGLIDAEFEGNITLELYNMAPWNIKLMYGMRICQIHFVYVDSPLLRSYAKIGSYNRQRSSTEPAYRI